jgi:hypothetical protein
MQNLQPLSFCSQINSSKNQYKKRKKENGSPTLSARAPLLELHEA